MKNILMLVGLGALGLAGCMGELAETGDDDGDGGDGVPDEPQGCSGSADVGASPMRRLTRNEYIWTVRELFGVTGNPAEAFPPDEATGGFYSNANTPIGEQELPLHAAAAESLASAFVQDGLGQWISCDIQDTSCVAPLIAAFGRRAFRRPLLGDEQQAFVDQYEAGRGEWGAATGLQLVIEAMLLSPQFLYHVELGEGSLGDGALVTLTGFEVASRLSYFLWQSAPDEALLDAAEAGDLATSEGLEAQARRMLADPRSERGVNAFYGQWLGIDGLVDRPKDAEIAPEWSPSLAKAMRRETMTFVRSLYAADGDGAFRTLLTAPYSFVNDELAAVYGLDVAGSEHVQVDMPPERRGGLLTQASFLAAHSSQSETSWVHRGKLVREKLLCHVLPPPPPDVDMSMTNNPERLENEACAGCHVLMDPIGKSFDRYDVIGAFDAASDPAIGHGEVVSGPGDVEGTYSDPVELAGKLADSPAVHACFSKQWLRYALRREDGKADRCGVLGLADSFIGADLDVRELAVAIVKMDGFRLRRAPAPE